MTKTLHNSCSFLAKHWRGQNSLPFAFWVNGILLSTLLIYFSAVTVISTSKSDIESNAFLYVGIILATMLLNLSLATWQAVGIYRSAATYNKKIWRQCARITVVLGFIFAVTAISHISYTYIKALTQ